ncbi:hypothetical protein [Paludisphaera mucosa]|uniref:Uncharacterized protein n=1 Tax=Paludisphaera mucosa TaxID=3030827 RepID=A0ABT6FD87_9BACT|nr:hypothetical protein [Paludisphaera mucosa]MDG3005557.1 hypothetical protein [Paludisphaera mucosa]
MAEIKGIFLLDGVVLVPNVSPDRRATTVRIEKLRVVGGDLPGPLSATRTATIHIPFEDAKAGVTVRQVVRGFARVSPGARGVILAQLGGATHQIPIPPPGSSGEDLVYEAESTIPAGRIYLATFFLLLERDADRPEFGGDLAIESLDVEILAPTPPDA